MSICNQQLLLFENEVIPSPLPGTSKINNNGDNNVVSNNILDSFGAYGIPFIGCDFSTIYPIVYSLLPQEKVSFMEFDLETAIMCEIVSAGICHKINWDFLRHAIFEEAQKQNSWITPQNLINVKPNVVYQMLGKYHHPENIKANERAKQLQLIGKWAMEYRLISEVFINKSGTLKSYDEIHNSLLQCPVFSSDPEEKKINILLQKLDSMPSLFGIGNYAKPAIDYHLLRLYLRRGLLYARTKYAYEYICNTDSSRREGTVAAIRELSAKLLSQISLFTGLNVSSVNLVEWNVARTVCDRDCPDCQLIGRAAQWLRPMFKACPFRSTCIGANLPSDLLIAIKEPSYKGTSY